MTDLAPICSAVERPQLLFDPTSTVHGLRAARSAIVAGQRFVDVWFYRSPPVGIDDPSLWRLLEPPGVAQVQITAAAIDGDHLRLTIAGLPDPTRYRLELTPPAGLDFDPLRVRLPVRMRPECPDLGNCFENELQAAPRATSPVTDYTARDWLALRQQLVEFHRRNQPGADTSAADPTITALELFAHVGDVLHYRLDRVATEAYLVSARARSSVRRHARLLDYLLADAVAARAPIHLSVRPGDGSVAVLAGDIVRPLDDIGQTFTIEGDLTAVDALGEIAVYDWGETACCLHAGATSAVLVRPLVADPLGASWLAPGDLIAFEVIDPGDLTAHDAWRTRQATALWPSVGGVPTFREPLPSRKAHVVALTHVEPLVDPLAPTLDLFHVQWATTDALPRAYPASVDTQRGAPEVCVVRGNLVWAHHGVLVDGAAGETLEELSPEWAANLPIEEQQHSNRLGWLLTGARQGLARRVDGSPYLLEVTVDLPSGTVVAAEAVETHLGVPPGVLAVTVEEESWRAPLLRFTTGDQGTEPPNESQVSARYEAGGGAFANVAANTLTQVERNTALAGQRPTWQTVPGLTARNPITAAGGADPEPLDRARRGAPQAFVSFARRAVLPSDYAEAARELSGIDRATATRTWTGAWPLIRVIVDLDGVDGAADLASATAHLDGLRMLGQEVAVIPGTGIALAIGLDICVVPGIDTELVRREILRRLRPGTDDLPGFFHATNLRLGGTIHTSGIVAIAASVHGVDAVQITMARRLTEPESTIHEVLTFEQNEIPVLDDDVARPDRGRLVLMLRGGR